MRLEARPFALVLRMTCGILAGGTGALLAHSHFLRWSAIALAALALVKLVIGLAARGTGDRTEIIRPTEPARALIFSGAVGITAAAAMLGAADSDIEILMLGYALVYGASMASGNAGHPLVGLGQVASVFLPIVIAACIIATPPMLVLAAILPLATIGLTYVTVCVFGTLAAQVRLARDSETRAQQAAGRAHTCPLTGLANRAGLACAADRLFAMTDRTNLALLWLDLYRFKYVNDTLGHETGDRVLVRIADRLQRLAPSGAVVSRYGSDDFIILAPVKTRSEAEQLAQTVLQDLGQPLRIEGHRIDPSMSLGVSMTFDGATDFADLMRKADMALYHAKAGGHDRVRFFDPALSRALTHRKQIEAELRGAILRDELSLYFQPVIDLRTGRIRSFEALVRWFHPLNGEMAPAEFIPVAEESGVIVTLGNWITRQAARTCSTWPAHVTLSVNISPAQIRAPGAALGILAALQDANLDPARLELEVTESLFVEDNPNTTEFMDHLAMQGVRFALDDFGTGHSSVHYINRYPFRTIKVDRSIVSGPQTGRESDAIIRAVAEMGATLDMEIVAEGLETVEQVRAMREAGCTLGQGYYFSRPVPDYMAAQLLAEEDMDIHPPMRAV